MISVVIPLYNKEDTIQKTVSSVLSQSFEAFELLIIDDGSTDGSKAIVEALKDQRIRVISKPNGGVSSARNRGISESQYDYIAFLDGDDWWHPDFLETLYNAATLNPGNGVWCCQYVQVDESGVQRRCDRFPNFESGVFDLASYFYAPSSSSVLLKKSVFDAVGGFNEELTHGEDAEMWVRISKKFYFFYLARVLAYYNTAGNPLSRSIGSFPEYRRHVASVLDELTVDCSPQMKSRMLVKKQTFLQNFYARRPFDRELNIDAKRYLTSHPELVPASSILRKSQFRVLFTRAIPLFLKGKFLGFKRKLQRMFTQCFRYR